MEGVFSERVYKYKKGNKTIVIKRKWNCKGNSDKNKALNDYLEQNRDIIPNFKTWRAVLEDYNSKNENNKVSYTTILKRLNEIYGKKNKHYENQGEGNQEVIFQEGIFKEEEENPEDL